jgi:hypothetical protein
MQRRGRSLLSLSIWGIRGGVSQIHSLSIYLGYLGYLGWGLSDSLSLSLYLSGVGSLRFPRSLPSLLTPTLPPSYAHHTFRLFIFSVAATSILIGGAPPTSYQCINVSMCPCINVSMYQCINVSMYQCINVSMYQCIYLLLVRGSHIFVMMK